MTDYCTMLKHGLCVTAYGAVNPCCATFYDVEKITKETNIVDLVSDPNWQKLGTNEDNNIPNGFCYGCGYREEKYNYSTRRKRMNSEYYNYYDRYLRNQNKKSFVHMDISFGNTCNQKCIMCNSNFSNKWLVDDIELLNIIPKKDLVKLYRNNLLLKNWSLTYDQIDQIISLIDEHTQTIEFKGGEPLYDKRFRYFVEKASDKNPKSKIIVTTNLTKLSDETLKFMNSIDNFLISVSIDSVGDTYKWIRDYDFAPVEENFKKLVSGLDRKHRIFLNHTAMKYNIDKISILYNWARDISKENNNRPIYFNFTQMVTSPTPLSPRFASKDSLLSGLAQLKSIKNNPEDFSFWSEFNNRIDILINYIQECLNSLPNDIELAEAKEFEDRLIKIRGWSIYD